MDNLIIKFISREKQKSQYDWADILFNNCSVGKARCLIEDTSFTIYSINIYPEYQGNGYGREFVEYAKLHYKKITADRVRFAAIGFWENFGFIRNGKTTNWIYTNTTVRNNKFIDEQLKNR